MKRFFCSVLLLFFISSTLYSRVITVTEAEKIALILIQIENNSPELRTTKQNIMFSNLSELIYMGEKIAYIIELWPKGFMIIPAFTELSPVKFISYSENYERLKGHPFIETIKDRLYYAQCRLGYNTIEPQWKISLADIVKDKIDIEQKEKNEGIWTNFLLGNIRLISASTQLKTAVAPLLTSRWDQGNPYNIYTPMIGNVHCITGCCATAAAQVMNYWKYPTSGQGVHSYYWMDDNSTISADFNHDYNWSNMLNSYNGSETQEQIDAVARLMSDIGISFDTGYSLTGSGAVIDNDAFVYFFRYSPEIAYVIKFDYATWNDWFNVFKSQLDKNWPALLSVYPRTGGVGHAVAIDGYRVENNINQVHANLGWGGAYDNYYSMDDIYGWGSERDMASINIHPPICNNPGAISGHVTDMNGKTLKNVHIFIYTHRVDPYSHARTAGNAWTDNNGYFKAECLNPGNYFVYYNPSEAGNYSGKWYNDKESYDIADNVVVTAGQITSGIDAHLGAACTITGRVVNYEGVGVPLCNVGLFSSSNRLNKRNGAQSNFDGYYALSNIPSGDYKIFFFPFQCTPNYAFEWFNDKSSFETAEIISVYNGQTASGIDARLELGGIISGRVTDLNGQGIQNIYHKLYDINHSLMESESDLTDINGNFTIARIRSGSYKIYFDNFFVQNKYASEWYNNKNSFEKADVINVTENQTISIITQLSTSLTIEASDGGTTQPPPGTYRHVKGTTVQVTAIPDANYRFANWSGDASGTSNPITILMDRYKTIKANFIRQYSLTIEADAGGTTTPSPGTYKYDTGTTVQVTAMPNDYYIFNNWTGTATGTSNPISLLMTRDFSIMANFRLIEPPNNFTGKKVLNRTLSQAEYINVLSWAENPNNAALPVAKYWIYQVDGGSRSQIAEVSPNVFKYQQRKVVADKTYTYEVAVVLEDGREGKPASVTFK